MKKKELNSRQVAEIWDANASKFTQQYTVWGDSDREVILNPAILEMMGDVTGKRILDAGCGEGYLSRLLAEKCERVIAVDYSEKMLSIAKSKTEHKNIEYHHETVEDLGIIESNTMDLAVSVTVLQDVPDYLSAIKEINRVLKPLGKFILAVTHPCFSSPGHGWYTDEHGYKMFWKTDNYFKEELNKSLWSDHEGNKRLIYFHRTLETYFTALTNNGFDVINIKEPRPSKKGILKYPWLMNDMRVAHYLIFGCVKGVIDE